MPADPGSCIFGPAMTEVAKSAPATPGITRLLEIMVRLRDPAAGCPWDIEQSFDSIAPYTIEEAYEVADAIEQGDMAALREELGDLLFQVVFHARVAEEAGDFDFDAIAQSISDKMVRRHPHVFGAAKATSVAAQNEAWEAHKAAERHAKAESAPDARPSVLDGLVGALPALTRAVKLQRRAARVGFDWPEPLQVLNKIHEEIKELRKEIVNGAGIDRVRDELGDLLFALVNLGRHMDIDPETALRHGNAKFERRFRALEARFAARGRPMEEASLEELEAAWQSVKAETAE